MRTQSNRREWDPRMKARTDKKTKTAGTDGSINMERYDKRYATAAPIIACKPG